MLHVTFKTLTEVTAMEREDPSFEIDDYLDTMFWKLLFISIKGPVIDQK